MSRFIWMHSTLSLHQRYFCASFTCCKTLHSKPCIAPWVAAAGTGRLPVPASLKYKLLRSLTISSNIVFPDLAEAAPNLKTIDIRHHRATKKQPVPVFNTLTQPSLTTFHWMGRDWETVLSTIPVATLKNITDLDMSCELDQYSAMPSPDCLDLFIKSLSEMHNLTTFTYQGVGRFVTIGRMCEVLKSIPSGRVERLDLEVYGWEYEMFREAVRRWVGVLKKVDVSVVADFGEGGGEGRLILDFDFATLLPYPITFYPPSSNTYNLPTFTMTNSSAVRVR
ncbi:hypothetical protein HDV00_008094 [Rhizophlyctis rosea]|nr:hypothetical protein HDV00_008094 [Rhizophlyctis rosea]